MGDYLKDIFLNSGITIKQEPQVSDSSTMSQSASVPIPPKRDMNDYRNFDFDYATSPIYTDIQLSGQTQAPAANDVNNSWGLSSGLSRLLGGDDIFKTEPFMKMDQDDIFQVDEADLIQGPTLAELNANDDNLLGDWNFDDLILPEDTPYALLDKNSLVQTKSNHLNNNISFGPSQNLLQRDLDLPSSVPSGSFDLYKYKMGPTLSPDSHHSSSSSIIHSSSSPLNASAVVPNHSTLQELLVKKDSNDSMLGRSYPEKNTSLPLHSQHSLKFPRSSISGLSSSAPTHLGLEQIWQRREPRKHLLSTSSLVEAGSTSSLSTGGLLSPELPDYSLDEESDEDSDNHYEDFSSEIDSDDEDRGRNSSSKKERYFWQYNVQAKGPKGQRLVLKSKMEDPHRLNEVTDPVFSPDCSVRGIKHSGKARKGDGNDLTPNPKKLHNIGRELDRLSRYINDMTPVSELPVNVRSTSRKEKNKLASRACRLKKKAQHEANKIKLSGLEIEHKKLINGIQQAKHIIAAKLTEQSSQRQEELTLNLEKVIKTSTKTKIAGHTTDYVNKILDRFRGGNISSSNTGYSEEL